MNLEFTTSPIRQFTNFEVQNMGRILIADDHDALRRGLVRGLTEAGHEIDEASNGNAAIERLHDSYFDIVLSDLKMGGSDGLDVLRTTKALHPTTAVILMTAFGSVTTAVEAMKSGAFDYVQKPFEIEEMEVKIEKALEVKRLKHELDYLRHTQQDIYEFDRIVGSSEALQRVLDMVKKVAKSNTTCLIRGETGTGKELIAGAVHHNSLRTSRNFVKVNCAALQENLLESELFGHEKGAFTGADKQRIGRFEQADGGTLFLDEIGDMSPSTQAKILRVLQEHEFERLGGTRTLRVDVRLIAATNRDLAVMVQSGRFREDLYYRLNVVSIEMPPLRERKDDIVPLAGFFIRRFSAELKKKMDGIDPEAQKLLMRYNWPGNIRELENTIERAMLLAEGRSIAAGDLRLGEMPTAGSGRDQTSVVKIPPTGIPLEDVERHALIEALKMSNWVQKDAAELLSISPRVMNYKIKVLGIEFPRGRRAAPLEALASTAADHS
jgi:two-component system response regulator AtoC